MLSELLVLLSQLLCVGFVLLARLDQLIVLLPGLDWLIVLGSCLSDEAAPIQLHHSMVNVVYPLDLFLNGSEVSLHLLNARELFFNLRFLRLCMHLLLLDLLLGAPAFGTGLHQVEGRALGCANRFAVVEYGCYLRIQFDVELLLLS